MQIVIDIPEEVKHKVYAYGLSLCPSDKDQLIKAIVNGKPLPKGHGRLIDADEAIKTLKSLGNRNYRREKGTIQEAIKMLSFDEYTSTIIDKEQEE